MTPTFILIVIISYFAVLVIVSILTSQKADSKSFFIGNKRSPWYLVAFGMIGASLSGVTFISVPGWVITSKFYYMQMVLGYLLGYVTIIHILLPLYYRLNLTSIYAYLQSRFGNFSYKTGAVFFLISRVVGASFRLYIVANVLQVTVFDKLQVPFIITVLITLLLIYIYTFRGGIKTIVWTDTLQTLFMLSAVVISIIFIAGNLGFDLKETFRAIAADEKSAWLDFDWKHKTFFLKQFLSGAFITIVMTGLDQDMMQKNLSCRNLSDAQKNMYWYSLLLVPVNLLFLSLGVLLVLFAQSKGITIPDATSTDDLFPQLATGGFMPAFLGVVFLLGLIAAAYSSADSALTALTTSVTIDLFNAENMEELKLTRLRRKIHVMMALIIGFVIVVFRMFSNEAVISSVFIAAGYTYGPLLGMYAFGLFTRRKFKDSGWIPVIAILAPIVSFLLKFTIESVISGYKAGYEILVLNGILTFTGLWIYSKLRAGQTPDLLK
jgi:Na+/proline symporter